MNRITIAILCGLSLLFGSACNDEQEDDDDITGPTPTPNGDDDDTTANGDDDDDDATDEVGTIPPTPTQPPPKDPLTTITVAPSYVQLEVGASVTYVVRGFKQSGTPVDITIDNWTSTDPSVATVDTDGKLTTLAAGTTFIAAHVGDVESSQVMVEVIESGTLNLKVIDAFSGAPVAGAEIYRGQDGTDMVTTDAEGNAVLTGDFSGPQTVTAAHPDYHLATIVDAVSRKLVLPLRSYQSTQEGQFAGKTDFSAMPNLKNDQVRVGLITRSFFGNPLTLDTNTVIGPNRDVTVCGAPAEIPSNIVGQVPGVCRPSDEQVDILARFAVPGPSGTYSAYMLAGDLELNEVLSWVTDPEIFYNLGKLLQGLSNVYTFAFDYELGIPIVAPEVTPDIPILPDGQTNAPLTVKIPKYPSGIQVGYPAVAFVLAEMEAGEFLPIGLAGGDEQTTVPVFHPPMTDDLEGKPLTALVMVAEEGVGNLGAYSAVTGEQGEEGEAIETPDFMPLIQNDELTTDINQRTFTFFPVEGATLYRSIYTFRFRYYPNGNDQPPTIVEYFWDIYQPGTASAVVLPNIPVSPEKVHTEWEHTRFHWEFFGYDNGEKSFDILTSEPSSSIYDSTVYLDRMTRNKIYDMAKLPK